jgi:iron complex transport system substrate-binding protein
LVAGPIRGLPLPLRRCGAITLGMDRASPELRVVSLIASATEILHALGAGASQVARSHECDWPEAVLDLPSLTRPKFKVEGSSRSIDQAVRSLVERGLAVYEVDADDLQKLKPAVILTQDQCEVCAVSLADVERAVCSWIGSTPHIVSLRPHTMSDVYTDIARVAAALAQPEAGENLVARVRARISAITAAVADRPKPRLAFIEWIDPPMSGGHWMPELIEAAGGVNLFGETGVSSPWITWDAVAAADPDVILVAPCGYDIAVTSREMGVLAGNATWEGLRAVREGAVYVADGNAYFNRPGPRLVESAEILAEILHPDVCDFGHRGCAFVPYSHDLAPLQASS